MGRLAAVALASLAVAAGPSGTVAAKDLRYPEKGPVAFLLHLPDGWNANLDDSRNMLVLAPDHTSALSLTVVHDDAESLKQTPDEFANASFAVAKAEPFSRHEKGAIAGVPAETYYSRMVNPNNAKLSVKMNLIKSTHDYIVSESILTVANISSAQQATLAEALKGITLTGAK